MDSFSPSQHQAICVFLFPWRFRKRAIIRRDNIRFVENRPIDSRRPVEIGIAATVGLNLLVPCAKALYVDRIVKEQQSKTNRSWLSFIADWLDYDRRRADLAFRRRWSLTEASWQNEKWYTWITSNFVHNDPAHLVGNIVSMLLAGQQCMRQANFYVIDLFAIVLGSSIACSAATLLQYEWYGLLTPWVACGASGVVYALGTIAFLGHTRPPPTDGDSRIQAWIDGASVSMIPMHLLDNVIGFVKSMQKRPGWREMRINYAGHLAGAAFGWLYYELAMKRRLGVNAVGRTPRGTRGG